MQLRLTLTYSLVIPQATEPPRNSRGLCFRWLCDFFEENPGETRPTGLRNFNLKKLRKVYDNLLAKYNISEFQITSRDWYLV
ncbi:MAG: hypothetical protein AABW49_01480 [Nanoarchaeota archaeon]